MEHLIYLIKKSFHYNATIYCTQNSVPPNRWWKIITFKNLEWHNMKCTYKYSNTYTKFKLKILWTVIYFIFFLFQFKWGYKLQWKLKRNKFKLLKWKNIPFCQKLNYTTTTKKDIIFYLLLIFSFIYWMTIIRTVLVYPLKRWSLVDNFTWNKIFELNGKFYKSVLNEFSFEMNATIEQ